MRYLCLFLVLSSLSAFGQDQAYVNTWGKGSRYIYVGLTNEVRFSEAGKIFSATSKEASVRLAEDSSSLIVNPRSFGPVTIFVNRESDSVELVYNATTFPFPVITIAGEGTSLSRSQVDSSTRLIISGDGSEAADFYNQCRLQCSEIQVGNTTYSIQNGVFSPELLEAIRKTESGEKLLVKRLVLESGSGKQIKLDPGKRFEIVD
jgi:hypothetical protein